MPMDFDDLQDNFLFCSSSKSKSKTKTSAECVWAADSSDDGWSVVLTMAGL